MPSNSRFAVRNRAKIRGNLEISLSPRSVILHFNSKKDLLKGPQRHSVRSLCSLTIIAKRLKERDSRIYAIRYVFFSMQMPMKKSLERPPSLLFRVSTHPQTSSSDVCHNCNNINSSEVSVPQLKTSRTAVFFFT